MVKLWDMRRLDDPYMTMSIGARPVRACWLLAAAPCVRVLRAALRAY